MGFNGNIWRVVIKDLANPFEVTHLKDCRFCVFCEGVIDDGYRRGEAGDPGRNGNGAIAIVGDTTAECDIGRSC